MSLDIWRPLDVAPFANKLTLPDHLKHTSDISMQDLVDRLDSVSMVTVPNNADDVWGWNWLSILSIIIMVVLCLICVVFVSL